MFCIHFICQMPGYGGGEHLILGMNLQNCGLKQNFFSLSGASQVFVVVTKKMTNNCFSPFCVAIIEHLELGNLNTRGLFLTVMEAGNPR